MSRARDGLRTAALALGFVAGLKVASLGGEHRVTATLEFMAMWLIGGACYWFLSNRDEVSQSPGRLNVWLGIAAVFDIVCVGVIWVLRAHG